VPGLRPPSGAPRVHVDVVHADGGGYPDGLTGDDIPLVARIIAACDAYNAMTTTRPYRRAMDHATAAGELARCAGSQFDPLVVEALLTIVGAAPRSRVRSPR
jgi:HD-GYP domain-containing protein (c-di-GMP phosphodiesterase class II)